jgi:hypothetical protein
MSATVLFLFVLADLGPHFSAGVEGKVVGAWARVPVVRGNADVPNLSLHGLVSAGRRF